MTTASLTSWTVQSLLALPYDDEQRAAIDLALAEFAKSAPGEFARYDRSSKLVDCGHGVVVAIVGDTAHEVPRLTRAVDGAVTLEYLPVVVDGQCIVETTEHGRMKMLVLARKSQGTTAAAVSKWHPSLWNTERVPTVDLERSPSAVGARLSADLPAGSLNVPSARDLGLS